MVSMPPAATTPPPAPAAQSAPAPADTAPADTGAAPAAAMTLEDMNRYTLEAFNKLGPRGPEIGEVLANDFGVERVADLKPEQFDGFKQAVDAKLAEGA